MNITILAVGKKRSDYDDMIAMYAKRIVAPFSLSIDILEPYGSDNAQLCRTDESKRLLSRLRPDDYVLVMDERGRDKTTLELSAILEQQLHQSTRHAVCIIGGAYGFDDTVRQRANLILRLSAFTLPHELARLVLTEQLYRTTNLLSGGKYHHS